MNGARHGRYSATGTHTDVPSKSMVSERGAQRAAASETLSRLLQDKPPQAGALAWIAARHTPVTLPAAALRPQAAGRMGRRKARQVHVIARVASARRRIHIGESRATRGYERAFTQLG